jgi:hypothetical protein
VCMCVCLCVCVCVCVCACSCCRLRSLRLSAADTLPPPILAALCSHLSTVCVLLSTVCSLLSFIGGRPHPGVQVSIECKARFPHPSIEMRGVRSCRPLHVGLPGLAPGARCFHRLEVSPLSAYTIPVGAYLSPIFFRPHPSPHLLPMLRYV